MVSMCLQLSCVSCDGVDSTFLVQVTLEILGGTAGQICEHSKCVH